MSVQSITPQISTPPVSQVQKRYPWHAVASFCIPGVGQFIKEDKEKGKRDLGIQIGLMAAGFIGGILFNVSNKINNSKNNFGLIMSQDIENIEKRAAKIDKRLKGALFLTAFMGILVIASFVNRIHSAVDAYKAKPAKEAVKES